MPHLLVIASVPMLHQAKCDYQQHICVSLNPLQPGEHITILSDIYHTIDTDYRDESKLTQD